MLLQPIDLLKTRVQQSNSQSIRTTVREISNSPNVLRSFWRGTAPSMLRTGMGSATYFTTLNAIRQYALRHSTITSPKNTTYTSSTLPKLSNTANMVSGALARVSAAFLVMPLTVIKVRYESNLYSYTSIAGGARDIFRTGGIRGFFAGYGATAARDAPSAGLYVLFYEQFKKRLSSLQAQRSVSESLAMGPSMAATINFSSGALASATCSFITNPFDAIKTRIQLQPQRYKNILYAARKIVVEDGVRALYDGLSLRLTRKAIGSALSWMLYEELIRRAETTWKRSAIPLNHTI
jgi:solute carrier family 25 protein 38